MKIYLFNGGLAVATSVGRGCEIIPAVDGTLTADGKTATITAGRVSIPPLRETASAPVSVPAQIVTDGGEWRIFNLASMMGRAVATDATADLVKKCHDFEMVAEKYAELDLRVAALEGKKQTALNTIFKL